MKKIIAIICVTVLTLTLSGCSFVALPHKNYQDDDGISSKPDVSPNESQGGDTFDYASVTVELNMGFNEDTFEETGTIVAKDKDGNTIWVHDGGAYPAAQLESYDEIGKRGAYYYYSEGGTIVALHLDTGKVAWKNSDFDGLGIKHVFGEDAIYLCGFFGPDFFAVSYEGNTLKRIEEIDDDYWYTSKLEDKGDKIAVHFDQSEDGNGGVFYVDKKTYKVTK